MFGATSYIGWVCFKLMIKAILFYSFFHGLHNCFSTNVLRNMKVPDMFYVEVQITNLPTVRYNRVVTQTYLDLVGKFITEIDLLIVIN